MKKFLVPIAGLMLSYTEAAKLFKGLNNEDENGTYDMKAIEMDQAIDEDEDEDNDVTAIEMGEEIAMDHSTHITETAETEETMKHQILDMMQ